MSISQQSVNNGGTGSHVSLGGSSSASNHEGMVSGVAAAVGRLSVGSLGGLGGEISKTRVQLELDALRSKHLAKNQRDRLKDCKWIIAYLAHSLAVASLPLLLLLNHYDYFSVVASAPLTTPEEAKAFLAEMRKQTQEREDIHKPPSHIATADGMDAWFAQQRQREMELRRRRQEAEALLRGYRGQVDESTLPANREKSKRSSYGSLASTYPSAGGAGTRSPAGSESLDDPRNFAFKKAVLSLPTETMNPLVEEGKEGEEKENLTRTPIPANAGETIDWAISDASSDSNFKRTHMDNRSIMIPDSADKQASMLYGVQERGAAAILDDDPAQETVWRDFISSEPGAVFPPEPGRYHLVSAEQFCSHKKFWTTSDLWSFRFDNSVFVVRLSRIAPHTYRSCSQRIRPHCFCYLRSSLLEVDTTGGPR
jgi:hypothetical protein